MFSVGLIHACHLLRCFPLHRRPCSGLGYGYIGARTDATRPSRQTPDKEGEIKNITVYVSGYTETDNDRNIISPDCLAPTSEFVSSRQSGQILAAVRIGFECRCNGQNGCRFNPRNPELNPICYLLALVAHHFLHVSRIMVKSLTLRLLMSYIYGAVILDVSRSHTTTQHSR